jgi:uncharacterized protein YkwD
MLKRKLFTFLFLTIFLKLFSQDYPELRTADKCRYMKPQEREMVYELNVVRIHPEVYLHYLEFDLENAKDRIRTIGKGERYYSLATSYTMVNRKTTVKIDTVWYYENEEELHAIETLIHDLKNLGTMPLLEPDEGLYKAARAHAVDNDNHRWTLGHRGSDGSWPDERIKKYSPRMSNGNENIAGKFPEATPREIVMQLLIDSGIEGYGHRINILDPDWNHVGCYTSGLKFEMYRWVQEFGKSQ